MMFMGKAPGHTLGEKLGWFMEEMLIRDYKKFAYTYGVYCDYKHKRKVRNNAQKVSWTDSDGNKHDLDIVYERNGSEEVFGEPCAFIEVAWRRYTKHSKNKAQEISGAILPIVKRYERIAPFYGAILAGDFTDNSLKQMESEGFRIIHFSCEDVFSSFSSESINIFYDATTSDDDLNCIVEKIDSLDDQQRVKVWNRLKAMNKNKIKLFNNSLKLAIERKIIRIQVCVLYGEVKCFENIKSACEYLVTLESVGYDVPVNQYEITVYYSNDDIVSMRYHDKFQAIRYIRELNAEV